MGEKITNLSEYILEQFGANATYVEGLLSRYRADPNAVDESWRAYFGDMLGTAAAASTKQPVVAPVSEEPKKPAVSKPASLGSDTEAKAITGPAKKIVENMEQSLSVPTATSFREIPVKLLEENRRTINEHLQARGRGKVSFTHIIAWAIVKAAKAYPQMNHGFAVVDGVPSRLSHEHINLGIAIDVEKKDGSRTLLVPNIKGAESMSFAGFFDAYNEQVKKAREGKLIIEDFYGTTISLTNPG
ncbi:MAG: 2-oxo acid dehydrogenase subunit E2, partial [Pyrinomonadaceae bacterium]